MWRWVRRGHLGSEADRATFRTLHTASLAAPSLRLGLTREAAEGSVKHLRTLLGVHGVALVDTKQLLAHEGKGAHHLDQLRVFLDRVTAEDVTQIAGRSDLPCEGPNCEIASAVMTPLLVDDHPVGALVALVSRPSAAMLRACDEVATWVSGQLDLAELDASRRRLMQAEVRALRAQISPHFIYNSLGAIASFVRTDPDRARELLLEFADFTRYSFRPQQDRLPVAGHRPGAGYGGPTAHPDPLLHHPHLT